MLIPQHLRRPIAMLAGLGAAMSVLVAGMAFPFAAGAGLVSNEAGDAVNAISAELIDDKAPVLTTVQDSAGQPVAYLYDQYRVPVREEAISPAMKAAVVAVEDRRFYVHDGVDWQATIRAVVANSASGDVVQGASTLSQQYVKNYLLYVDARTESAKLKATEQTSARKLKEARIALQLERSLNKDEILTRYLNIVFWGNNAYGVAAAARTYFDTTPDKLTIPQAAMLAGMVRSTSAYDPIARPEAALERRNAVVHAMAEQGMITQEQAKDAVAAPLGVANPLKTLPNGCIGAGDAGFFCKYVVDYLKEAGFSVDQINRGGYTIKTTLDSKVLQQTSAALKAEVPPTQSHVANNMSVVEPGKDKHRVRAMASSRFFGVKPVEEQTSYGLPYEPVRLGAGSIYKIFTATTALKKGLGINDIIPVPPDGYTSPIFKDDSGRPIPVHNAGAYGNQMSLQDALAQSPNTAFVKLEEFTGIPDVVDTAVQLGMRSLAEDPFIDPRTQQRTNRSIAQVIKDQALASFTLGPTETSVLELANVGATLSSAGMWCPPSPIESVTDAAGRPVPVIEEQCSQVVDAGLANTMMVALSKDDTSGTAAGAAGAFGWHRPMAGKTGTTQQHKSAGFVGVVPQLSAAVITFDNSRSPRPLCDGGGAPFACGSGNIYGGKTPAQTWFRAMTGILAGQPELPLAAPDPRYINGGAQKPVPDVVGRGVNEARALLQRAGWQVSVREVDGDGDPGTVQAQNPSKSALPGTVILLEVSNGSGSSSDESTSPSSSNGGGNGPDGGGPGG